MSRHGEGCLQHLPPELLLSITTHLEPDAFIRLALALYPRFQVHELVPRMTQKQLHSLQNGGPATTQFPSWPFPPEISLQILRQLQVSYSEKQMMEFVLTHYHLLRPTNVTPPITTGIVQQLRQAIFSGG